MQGTDNSEVRALGGEFTGLCRSFEGFIVRKLISLTLSAVLIFLIASQTTASANGNLNYARDLANNFKWQEAFCAYEEIIYAEPSYYGALEELEVTDSLWLVRERQLRWAAINDFVLLIQTAMTSRTGHPIESLRKDAKLFSQFGEVAYQLNLARRVDPHASILAFILKRAIFIEYPPQIPRLCKIPKEEEPEEYTD